MSTVRVTYFGMDGEGKNVTEAKRDAGAKIERLVSDCYPRIYVWRGHTLIACSTSGGGSYTIARPDHEGQVISSSSAHSRHDAEIYGLRHLFTLTRKSGEFEIPAWALADRDFRAGVAGLLDEWKRDDEFQSRYREAQASGMSDNDAHSYAGRNPARPELWAA